MGPRLIRQNDGPFSAKGPGLEQASRDYLTNDYGAVVAYAPALDTGPLDPALPLRFQGQGIAPSKLPVGELWTGPGGRVGSRLGNEIGTDARLWGRCGLSHQSSAILTGGEIDPGSWLGDKN